MNNIHVMKTEQSTPRLVRQVIRATDIMNFFGKKDRMSYKIMATIRKQLGKKPRQPITISEFCDYYKIKETDLIHSIINANDKEKRKEEVY